GKKPKDVNDEIVAKIEGNLFPSKLYGKIERVLTFWSQNVFQRREAALTSGEKLCYFQGQRHIGCVHNIKNNCEGNFFIRRKPFSFDSPVPKSNHWRLRVF